MKKKTIKRKKPATKSKPKKTVKRKATKKATKKKLWPVSSTEKVRLTPKEIRKLGKLV